MRKYDSDPMWRIGTALKTRRARAFKALARRNEQNERERDEFKDFLRELD
jgi:hypothetical protein